MTLIYFNLHCTYITNRIEGDDPLSVAPLEQDMKTTWEG